MPKLRVLCLLTALFAPSVQGRTFPFDGLDQTLRLRLGDRLQERRTTSLNWFDLAGLAQESRARIPGVPPRFRVMIDPGHGGKDLGAIGVNGIVEKEMCLKIARLVRRELDRFSRFSDIPIETRLSREEDQYLALRERVRMANAWGADLFVSVHLNSSDTPLARGFEVYFLSAEATDGAAGKLARLENDGEATALKPGVLSILSDVQANQHVTESSHFAEAVFEAMSRTLRSNGRGVRQAPFTVLSGTTMPALLVEVAYLTHRGDALRLKKGSYLKRVAGAISTGILEFGLRKFGRTQPGPT